MAELPPSRREDRFFKFDFASKFAFGFLTGCEAEAISSSFVLSSSSKARDFYLISSLTCSRASSVSFSLVPVPRTHLSLALMPDSDPIGKSNSDMPLNWFIDISLFD